MNRYRGLDVLRGFGVFFLLGLHSAFYYFGGLYHLDLNNPPLIITILGFLLMFAGLFAILSGFGHTISMERDFQNGTPVGKIIKKKLVAGLVILVVAYAYFIFTGPGIVHFETESMNNSILVELIQSGTLVGTNWERVLYIDSLVMIGTNIVLLGVLYPLLMKKKWNTPWVLGGLAVGVMLLSLLRIPLYSVYLNAVDQGQWWLILLLNGLVNKNNPILPFFAFALTGALVVKLYALKKQKIILIIAPILLVGGIIAYTQLPDTMLERLIDMKWYSIMVAQLGIFLLMVMLFMKLNSVKTNPITHFFERIGIASLTAFFFESILSACVFRLLSAIFPGFNLDITGALIYGFCLAFTWGFIMMLIEKFHFRFTIDALYGKLVSKITPSHKLERLKE